MAAMLSKAMSKAVTTTAIIGIFLKHKPMIHENVFTNYLQVFLSVNS